MKGLVTLIVIPLAWLLIASTSVKAAPLYSQWDSVAPIMDQTGDAGSGIDIDSLRFAKDAAGTYYFRMDVNGQEPVLGATYSFYAANSSALLDPQYIFTDKFKSVVSFTKTFTNDTDSDATAHFSYSRVNQNRFFLEWSLENDATLNPTFYILGTTYWNSTQGGSDATKISATPIPAAGWLLASGILCLIGLSRKV